MPKKINNSTEFFEAIVKDDQKKVKSLIEERGVTLASTTDDDYQTAVHVAAQHGNLPLATYFLEKDAGLVDAKDKHGQTVLHIAAKRGDLDLLKHLVNVLNVDLRLPANRLKEMNTPVHIATEAGHLHIVKWYIEEIKPFKPDLRNEDGETLLMSAAKKAHLPIVKYLIEDGYANPFLLDTYDANVLFHSAVIGDLTVPRYLLDERKIKLDPDWKNVFGITVVFMGARFNHLDFIKYFVEEKRAIVQIANYFDWTPLHEAANENNLEIVKYLNEKNAGWGREDLMHRTPAQVTKDKRIIDYFKQIEKERREEYEEYERRGRARRSVSELFVRHSPQQRTPIPCRWLQRRINDQFAASSSASLVDSSAPFKTIDASFQLDSFLMLAGVCAKYVTGVGSEPTKNQALLSPPEFLRERLDPIAFDAIDAMYDFEYPHMNND